MRRLPSAALTTLLLVAGALLTLGLSVGSLDSTELGHLAVFLAIAVVVTLVATAIAANWLARATMRVRFVSIAAFATLIGLTNLAALAFLMLVSNQDAIRIAALLVYAAAAGTGAALAMARESTAAMDRLTAAAEQLAAGDLATRVARIDGNPELQALGQTLNEMADRLGTSLGRERAAEGQRRDLVIAVSHDLRTPLSGLRAMIEAIDDRVVEDPATMRRYVREMGASVASLVTLIDDLFELVQLDVGAIEAETERGRVKDIIGLAVAACDAQATEKGLVLRTQVDGAADAPCSPRVSRVVQNLIQNAIRHTPTDGTVLVEARRHESGIELVVEDSGEGIPPESIERIFDPFWRGDGARASDGSGLGLALAKRIVEALGGSIAVYSAPDRGSRFEILLPDPA